MAIKILGGEAKGLSLFIKESESCRPTLALLKRRIFDANQDLSDHVFIDACAGTGAMGLEALSRGVEELFLIESSRQTFALLHKNVEKVQKSLSGRGDIRVHEEPVSFEKWLPVFKKRYVHWKLKRKQSTILFVDPPYAKVQLIEKLLNDIISNGWFDGVLWIESEEKKGLPLTYWDKIDLPVRKIFKQGNSYIIVIELGPNSL